MHLRIIDHDGVRQLLPMRECIDLMAEALGSLARAEAHNPLRFIVRPPGATGLMGLMPAYRGGSQAGYGLKAVCVLPDNPARGLDTHQGAVMVHHAETGELRGLLNASAITAVRTAAVTALATRLLARPDAARLAVLGAGIQGRTHLEAMALVRPIERARVWSRRTERAQLLAEELGPGHAFPIEAAETPRAAVDEADIVVTVTSASAPIVERGWLAEGAHLNAVGSCLPTTRELDGATMAAATLFCDARESLEHEAGDYLLAIREGAIGSDHGCTELGDVIVGRAPGRSSPREITLFKSLGLAVEDLVAAQYVLDRAVERGAGAVVSF